MLTQNADNIKYLSELDRPIIITLFEDLSGRTSREKTMAMRELAREIEDTTAKTKKGLPLIKLGLFDGPRCDASLVEITGVEADYDGGEMSLRQAERRLREARIAALIHTSPSHDPEAPRFRVLCPISRPLPPERRSKLVARVNGVLGGALDASSFTRSQTFFIGSVESDRPPVTILVEGRPIDLCDDLDAGAIGPHERVERSGEPSEPLGMSDDEIWSILDAVQHLADDRETWRNVGMALKHELGQDGWPIFDAWSKRGRGYDKRGNAAQWRGFKNSCANPITMRSIVRDARAAGWSEDIAAEFDELDDETPKPRAPRSGLQSVRASDVTPKAVDWLWRRRLARGKLTMLSGDPEMGKSQLSFYAAARITKGDEWTDGGHAPKGSVLVLSAEDSADDTIVPRLMAAGAELRRVEIINAVRDKNKFRSFSLQADLDALGRKVDEIGDVALVIIDPITSYMGAVDSHRTTDVRAVLEPVANWADRHRVAILAVTHPPKAAQAKAINALTGSLAFAAAARLVFLAAPEEGTGRRLLLPVKSNIGTRAPGLAYRIIGHSISPSIETSAVEFDDGEVTMTADEALNQKSDERKARTLAVEGYLRDILEAGPMAHTEIMKDSPYSEDQLDRAKKRLGIKSIRDAFDGGWTWRLP